MIDFPPNWDKYESEYNRHYDPYEEPECPSCSGNDLELLDELFDKYFCNSCEKEFYADESNN